MPGALIRDEQQEKKKNGNDSVYIVRYLSLCAL